MVTRFWYPETNSFDWKSWNDLIPRVASAAVFVVTLVVGGFVDEQFYVILRTIDLFVRTNLNLDRLLILLRLLERLKHFQFL